MAQHDARVERMKMKAFLAGVAATVFVSMRVLAVVALLVAVPASVGEQYTPKTKQQKKESKNQAVQPKPTTPTPEVLPSTPASAPTPQAKEQTPKPELKPFLSHGEWVIGSLTAIYVVISFFSFMAIKRQAHIAEQAATAAQDAAKAAERNTEALINIERPFLLVTGVRYDVLPGKTPDGHYENASHVHFTFKNFGNSPAWCITLGGRFKAFAKADDLLGEPDYGNIDDIETYGIVLPPGEEREILNITHQGAEEEFSAVVAGELFWFAYGFFRYRDIFGRTHETRFCYASSGGRAIHFRPHQAPPAYNRHT